VNHRYAHRESVRRNPLWFPPPSLWTPDRQPRLPYFRLPSRWLPEAMLAAPAFVQQGHNNNPIVVLGVAPTNGNALIGCFEVENATLTGVSGGGVTWVKIGGKTSGTIDVEIWAGFGVSSGGITITASYTSGATSAGSNVSEFSGLSGFDVVGAGHTENNSNPTDSVTTTNAADLVVIAAGWASSDLASSVDSGFTLLTGDGGPGGSLGAAYQIESSTGTYSPKLTLTNPNPWAAIVAAFKGSAPLLGEDSYVTGRRVDQDLWRTAYIYG
jgi:hypothetical protein